MSSVLAWIALGLAFVLALAFHPRVLFGPTYSGGFLSLRDLFRAAHWVILALAVGSLVAFGMRSLRSGGFLLAAVLCGFELIAGFPLLPGDLTLWRWFQENRARAARRTAEAAISSEFAGTWVAEDGAVYRFQADAVEAPGCALTGPPEYAMEAPGTRGWFAEAGLQEKRMPRVSFTCLDRMASGYRVSEAEIWLEDWRGGETRRIVLRRRETPVKTPGAGG